LLNHKPSALLLPQVKKSEKGVCRHGSCNNARTSRQWCAFWSPNSSMESKDEALYKDAVAKGGHVLFVGTKKQAHEPIKQQSARVGMPYVTERWLGGMLTNFPTVYKRVLRLKELEALETANDQLLTKKELLVLRREREKLNKNLDGIRNMTKLPAAIWVVDTKKEHLAVAEAKKLGIPVIAILDTNCDPDEVDFKIPGNDDAIRSIGLLTRVMTDAIVAGLQIRSANAAKVADKAAAEAASAAEKTAEQPLADWEKDLIKAPTETAGA